MKSALLLAACATLIAGPAFACRGTAEYPEVSAQLAKADLPAAEKSALTKKLDEGAALHRRGHEIDDETLRAKSLEILDQIKGKISH